MTGSDEFWYVGSRLSFPKFIKLSGKTDSLGFGTLIDYLISETATDLRLNISKFFAKSVLLFGYPGSSLRLGLIIFYGFATTSGTLILFSILAAGFSFSTFSTIW